LQGGGGSNSDHYIDDDYGGGNNNNNNNNNVDGENDDDNGDVKCKAFTSAAEGIKSPQVASCGSLEQSPLF
jgi:hypothetical protein